MFAKQTPKVKGLIPYTIKKLQRLYETNYRTGCKKYFSIRTFG